MVDKAFTKDGLAPGGVVLHPRSFAEMVTYIDGEVVNTSITPNHVVLRRGSHNKADEAIIEVDGSAFDFPIRLIGGGEIALYLGVAPDESPDSDIRDVKNLRFVGYVFEPEEDYENRTAKLEAQDLSYFCRRKTVPVRKTTITDANGVPLRTIDPTPRYGDSLRTNIERLLSILPEFSDSTLEPPLRLRDTDALNSADLSSLVSGRAANAPIALRPDCTVWEAIEHLCGLLGLHVKVDLREIVVRTAEEVFAGRNSDPVTFIFGDENGNSFGPKFRKQAVHNRNGVRVEVYDPEQRKKLVAVFPSDSEVRKTATKSKRSSMTRAPTKQKTTKKKPQQLPPPPRDVYELEPGHFTQDGLNAKAQAIYLERSRGEATGEVATPIWTEEVLGLKNGDVVTIKVDPNVAREIERLGDDNAASLMLQDRHGYEKAAADAIVRLSKKKLRDDWYVKEVVFEHPGERLVTVHVLNLVEV